MDTSSVGKLSDPKVIATPHVGGLTLSASENQAMDTVRQVQALLDGVVPDHAVNAGHAARRTRLPSFSGALRPVLWGDEDIKL
ncbi:D-isomer specific 2-hydroxyacid dehydrogenase [Caballeronia udeis]|uniref:D-isomer specific 2-hydroxyacid dehydrogenase n=1 Tax=Caballeronia udeis TaxID=1232866 RepID=A0A158J8M4_9BURK|nr:D-isomer specific 2-hydroxyacid dehydrogenase [Caballeronia udeis]